MFNTKKILKKWGNSLIIVFNKEECKINNLEEDKIINLSVELEKEYNKNIERMN